MNAFLRVLYLFLATLSVAAAPNDPPPPNASITMHLCEVVRDACGPNTLPVSGQIICTVDTVAYVSCTPTDSNGNATNLVHAPGLVSVGLNPTAGYECATPQGFGICSSVVFVGPFEAKVMVWGVKFSGWRVWLPVNRLAKGE